MMYVQTPRKPTYLAKMSATSGGQVFDPPIPFDLTDFLNNLAPQDNVECWKAIDRIYDNLLDNQGRTRSLAAIAQIVQDPIVNPQLADNTLLEGINFAQEVYTTCCILQRHGVLPQAMAKLGQSKPFLPNLARYLTMAERENRHTTAQEAQAEPNHPHIPPDLLKSSTDVLAFQYWYHSLVHRVVPGNHSDVPKNFAVRAGIARRLFDAILEEPENMIERAIPNDSTNPQDNVDQEEEGEKVHPQVLKVRQLSPLSKLALSWDMIVSIKETRRS